jgi:predicted histone-like DNA-binding protein
MTVKYTVVPKKNPRDPAAPRKYYPIAVSKGHTDLREIAERIALISTDSTIDSLAMLGALLLVIPEELADGRIVRLGEFGSFSLTIQANGEDQPQSVGTHNIRQTKVHFKPGKVFKGMLKDLKFHKD